MEHAIKYQERNTSRSKRTRGECEQVAIVRTWIVVVAVERICCWYQQVCFARIRSDERDASHVRIRIFGVFKLEVKNARVVHDVTLEVGAAMKRAGRSSGQDPCMSPC